MRLVLVPPPRKNQIRYSGIFGSNARLREKVVPKEEPTEPKESKSPHSKRGIGWAALLKRVFGIDLECPSCHAPMKIISFITDPVVIKSILTSMKMPTAPPEVAKAKVEFEQADFAYDYAQ